MIFCIVPNTWSTWSTWSLSTACPATRTRTRMCTVNTTVDASLPTCNGTCVLGSMNQSVEDVETARCNGGGTLATNTGILINIMVLWLPSIFADTLKKCSYV